MKEHWWADIKQTVRVVQNLIKQNYWRKVYENARISQT